METTAAVSPALKALQKVRTEIKSRVGKEGGNLNERMLAHLDTIETTLLQIAPLGNMLKIINQQTEIAVSQIRLLNQARGEHDHNGDGDDGTSETKGQ